MTSLCILMALTLSGAPGGKAQRRCSLFGNARPWIPLSSFALTGRPRAIKPTSTMPSKDRELARELRLLTPR